jgi:hypothetical protein
VEAIKAGRIVEDTVRSGGVSQNPRVGASGHRDAVERLCNREYILERARHRAATSAAGEHKSTVDVEKNECGGVQRSAFAANITGARTFRRWLFIETDTLAFVELVEAALDRTAMKEPLLPAVVANEPEPSVANESFDSAARHPSLLGLRAFAQGRIIKFRSRQKLRVSGAFTAE